MGSCKAGPSRAVDRAHRAGGAPRGSVDEAPPAGAWPWGWVRARWRHNGDAPPRSFSRLLLQELLKVWEVHAPSVIDQMAIQLLHAEVALVVKCNELDMLLGRVPTDRLL